MAKKPRKKPTPKEQRERRAKAEDKAKQKFMDGYQALCGEHGYQFMAIPLVTGQVAGQLAIGASVQIVPFEKEADGV